MNRICLYCYKNPKSHSFVKVNEFIDNNNRQVILYYTKPADAELYYDTDSIITHYRNELKTLENRYWIWEFDAEGFGFKHSTNISLALQLSKVITNEFGEKLLEIRIRNMNKFSRIVLNAIWYALNKSMREKIKYI